MLCRVFGLLWQRQGHPHDHFSASVVDLFFERYKKNSDLSCNHTQLSLVQNVSSPNSTLNVSINSSMSSPVCSAIHLLLHVFLHIPLNVLAPSFFRLPCFLSCLWWSGGAHALTWTVKCISRPPGHQGLTRLTAHLLKKKNQLH